MTPEEMEFELEKCPICGGGLSRTPPSLLVDKSKWKIDWCWKCGKQFRIVNKKEQKGNKNEQ